MAAEAMEKRGLAEGNAGQQNAPRTQSRSSATSALARIREVARTNKKAKFTALLHHVTPDRLKAAFLALKRDAAPGIDGVTWVDYTRNLDENLQDLHGRVHRGAYRAKASRRVYIPKADGRQRPLGIASLEDKILQRAVVEVLNAIYEEDFIGFSYGFRPGRSQHDALDALAVGLLRRKVNWVLDADIRGYFDAISHDWLRQFVEHRIADRRILRLIQKWLAAGVLDGETWKANEDGTPQGGVASPLLSNVYLHYVFDLWALNWRQKRARGDMIVTRYADDFVVGFQYRSDAELFLAELRERMLRFQLELHPEKTRLIEFGRFAARDRAARGQKGVETFSFLGFTHICAISRQGGFQLRRRTISKRLHGKLREINQELRKKRYLPLPKQGRWLRDVVRGYFQYHAVPTNTRVLSSFRASVTQLWHRHLRRRSQRTRQTWARTNSLAKRWLPPARISHPWPDRRFDVRTRGKSPVR